MASRVPMMAARRRPWVVLLLAGPALCRECGQAEIDARDITGCSTVLHMKNLGHRGALWLGDSLHHNPNLEFLDLHHTFIADDDAEALADGLHNNTHLKRLAMHNNRITDKGAAALGRALAHNNALEFLSLSSNGVGDAGAAGLAEGLKANHALRRLDLYFNLVGDKGAVAFAEALEVNTALRTLHLDTNSVGELGGLSLCEAIGGRGGGWLASAPPPKVFAELTFLYNHLSNLAAEACIDAAAANPYLHKLELGHNHALRGPTKERVKSEHDPRMKERMQMATWIVDNELIVDHWHSPEGPPLATPYAAAVIALKLHTKEGLLALKHDNAAALAARAELQSIRDEAKREKLVAAILKGVAALSAHDEL